MIQCRLQYLLFPKQRPDFIVSSISVVLPVLVNASGEHWGQNLMLSFHIRALHDCIVAYPWNTIPRVCNHLINFLLLTFPNYLSMLHHLMPLHISCIHYKNIENLEHLTFFSIGRIYKMLPANSYLVTNTSTPQNRKITRHLFFLIKFVHSYPIHFYYSFCYTAEEIHL